MIVEYIRYRLGAGRAKAFVEAYTRAAQALDASAFCTGYELTRCVDEPQVFILRIEWTSAADHMRGFRKSPEFRAFLPEIRPFIDEIEEMRHYAPTEVVSP